VSADDVRPGDRVRLTINDSGCDGTFTIEGVVSGSGPWMRVGGRYLRSVRDDRTVEVLERTTPPEPGDLTVWVVDCDDSVWQRRGSQWHHLQSGELQPWIDLHHTYGPLRPLTPGEPL
jgi:hypothetical protein